METYNINPKFRIKYQMNRIHVSLAIREAKKHYIYDLVELLKKVNEHLA
jgi:hypothetical protein